MFNMETIVKIEEINSVESLPATVVMSGFQQEEIKDLTHANLHEDLLLQDPVKQENSCSKLLPYQIKSEHPDMKYEITEDNYDIKLENFIAEEEFIYGTTSKIELIEIKKGFSHSNMNDNLSLEDVGKQDSCSKSIHIKVKSEMIDAKYESTKDDVDIKLEKLAHEELIIKDEATETVHSKEKPFNCYLCNYKFIKNSNLQRHMKIHTGEERFNCYLCDYKCMDNYTLRYHMKTHPGEKPYKCNECDYKCIRKSDLQKHIKIHIGEKPFICNVCDSKFALKTYLRVHTIIHIDE